MTDRDERLLEAFLDELGSAPVPTGLSRRVSRRIEDEHPARASRVGAWFMPFGAALALVAFVGFVVITGGPKPSPSVLPVPPSASPSASAASSPSVSVTLAPIATPSVPPTGLPNPSDTPSPSASAPAFHVTLDPGGNPLPVLVSDGSSTDHGRGGPDHNLSTTNPVEVVQGPSAEQGRRGLGRRRLRPTLEVTVDARRTAPSPSAR